MAQARAGDLAHECARRLLDEHQRMVQSGADRDSFLAAASRRPNPTPRLVAALKRHRELFDCSHMIEAIEPLGKHDRAAFSCGVAALDDWFRLRAGRKRSDGRAHASRNEIDRS